MIRERIKHDRVEHRHASLRDNFSWKQHTAQRYYYWIWFDRDGSRKGLWGAYSSYEEADRRAVSKLNVPYEIVRLPTRDETEAGRMLRARMLGDTGDIEATFRRFSHEEKNREGKEEE